MVRILITDGIDQTAAETLETLGCSVVQEHFGPEELKEAVRRFDALVVRSATKVRRDTLDSALEAGRLKLIVRGGVGLDNIDVAYAEANGIAVRNTPWASSISVAELAVGHMFSLARNISISNVTMRDGQWNKKQYKGVELSGKTLGLVGYGRIARQVAVRAQALGMKVLYTNRRGPVEDAGACRHCTLERLLGESDFISIHVPFDKERGPLIGPREFGLMKDGAFLVNTARGGVVCEKALLEALESGRIAGAAVDVYEEEPNHNLELVCHPRVSCTPHIGASTREAQCRIGEEIVQTMTQFFNLRR